MPKFRYCAVEYRQVEGGPPVFLFAAPCHEVNGWAGIPRKEAKEGVQTVGFQRVKNAERLKKLRLFLGESHNVIANPILCAVRSAARIKFEPLQASDGDTERIGWLSIEEPDYDTHTLLQLLQEVEGLLIHRLPRLADIQIGDEEVADFCRNAHDVTTPERPADEATAEEEVEEATEEPATPEAAVEFSSESHLENFFYAVRIRRLALERTALPDRDLFEGFSKAALKDYLHAATVVDGQHRLLGAQLQLAEAIETEEARAMQDEMLGQGTPGAEVLERIQKKLARRLGIALKVLWSRAWYSYRENGYRRVPPISSFSP